MRAIYRFIFDVILAILWLIGGVLSLAMVVILFAAAIAAALLGCLIFGVIWVRDSPSLSDSTTKTKLKLPL